MRIKKIPITLRRRGDVIYPKTVAKQIVFEDGKNLEEKMSDLAYSILKKTYLTFECVGDETGSLSIYSFSDAVGKTIQVSTDGGQTWASKTASEEGTVIASNLQKGDKVLVKGNNSAYGVYDEGEDDIVNCLTFHSDDSQFAVYGNIMSLVAGDDFVDADTIEAYAFARLFGYDYVGNFDDGSYLIDAANLLLPATALAESCYNNMFGGCSSLTSAPALPATTLADYCYSYMFYDCTSLTAAPALPATTLADYCYSGMFWDCTSLTAAPALPATTLAENCYSNMFSVCTSLTTAPALPATTLAESCYSGMFSGCTSLTSAPALPATTLAADCYSGMFRKCTSLTSAPALPATTLVTNCYSRMFDGCTKLAYIKALFTTTPSSSYTNYWILDVAATGTFVKSSAATWNVTDANGVPPGWTVETE